jgi:type II secretory pathway pseudopilin PulG
MAHLTLLGKKTSTYDVAGFAYIALLLTLAGLGLILGLATEQIEHTAQRDREEQLLFVGKQFRSAIADYYEKSPGTKQYPRKLEELLLDKRFLKPVRHLRRIYIDPMTNDTDWQLIRTPQGGIVGVNSRSELTPIRTQLDADMLKAIGDRPVRNYSDWKFIYQPRDGSADLILQKNVLQENEDNSMLSDPDSPFGQLSNDSGLEQSEQEQQDNPETE